MENNKFKCNSCSAPLEINLDEETVVCPYCGTVHSVSSLLNETENLQAERIKTKAYKDIEKEKLKYQNAKDVRDINYAKEKEENERTSKYKRSFFGKLTLFFALACAVVGFVNFKNEKVLAGLFSYVLFFLFGYSWLSGIGFIKEKRKNQHVVIGLLGIILMIVPVLTQLPTSSTILHEIYSTYVWPSTGLSTLIPTPKCDYGEILTNNDKHFSINVNRISKDEFNEYIKECENAGFTEKVDYHDGYYKAYNTEEYKLSLTYTDSSNKMSIDIYAPATVVDIDFDQFKLGAVIPAIYNKQGSIKNNTDDYLLITIYDTSLDEFNEYIKECENAGFDEETKKLEDSFKAYNSSNYELSIEYDSYWQRFSIRLDAPMEMTTITWPDSELGKMLPVPKSNQGNVYSESSHLYIVYIGNTTQEDFNDYVDACIEKGFKEDYTRSDSMFIGHDSDGNSVDIMFEWRERHVMKITGTLKR